MTSPMPQDLTTPVLRNVDLGRGNWLLEFEADEMAASMRPAQFFMIGVPGSDVLLRRPFSVCGLPGTFEDGAPRALQVLYRVYGRGTSLLASLRPGAALHVLGPLGRGFEAPDRADARPVFVAGGIGSAPFPAFAVELTRAAFRPTMIYGARSSGELPLLDWFRARCESVTVTTDDGSMGTRGLVTGPLGELLAGPDRDRLHVYACGPSPMLKAVARQALAAGVRCDLALEAPMACGFGVCLGCVVPTRGTSHGEIRYERVCVEGPVMRAEHMAW
jgi:dihydroorotate dehydrogenase electron transfer subunit